MKHTLPKSERDCLSKEDLGSEEWLIEDIWWFSKNRSSCGIAGKIFGRLYTLSLVVIEDRPRQKDIVRVPEFPDPSTIIRRPNLEE